jgi:hypothetical protein
LPVSVRQQSCFRYSSEGTLYERAGASAKFGLQFELPAAKPRDTAALPVKTTAEDTPKPPPRQPAEIVTLDKLHKK